MEFIAHPADILSIAFGCALVTWIFWSILMSILGCDDEIGE